MPVTAVSGSASGIGAAVCAVLRAAGHRIIGIDRANAEVVAEGETGFLVTAPGEWSDRIARLANDAGLCRQLGEAGRRRVETDYSLGPVFERLRSVIAGLA